MGSALPIPVTEIKAYCDMFDITLLDDRSRFLKYIRSMDNAYLELSQKEPEKTDKNTKS